MWSNVIGQHRVKEILQRAILSNRVAHAYCLWGNEGIGKDAMALEFARVVNCFSPKRSEGSIEACGECKSCVQASHLQHPNITMVFSLPAGKSSSSDDDSPLLRLSDEQIAIIQEQLAMKAQNPYHNINIPNATQIKIASIRDVKKTIGLSQPQQGRRVVIISEADEMTNEAANAFLKTLEEPNANVTLIVTTSRKDQIPQTILSRCQQVYLDPLADEDIAHTLVAREQIDEQSAMLTASLAQGSYARALELLGEDTQRLRNDIVDLLRAALRNTGYRQEVMHKLDELTANADRPAIEKMLLLLMTWLRDAAVVAATQSERHVINADQSAVIRKFADVFGSRDVHAALLTIEDTIRAINQNAQVHLSLLTMLISFRKIFALG